MSEATTDILPLRTWRYVMEPNDYSIAGCKCGNANPQYSEFKDRLWCEHCEIDFEPEHWGIFDGPIPLGICRLMGISFDRIDMTRTPNVWQVFVPEDNEYVDHSGLALPFRSVA